MGSSVSGLLGSVGCLAQVTRIQRGREGGRVTCVAVGEPSLVYKFIRSIGGQVTCIERGLNR